MAYTRTEIWQKKESLVLMRRLAESSDPCVGEVKAGECAGGGEERNVLEISDFFLLLKIAQADWSSIKKVDDEPGGWQRINQSIDRRGSAVMCT